MVSNLLKLNTEKTEFMILGTYQQIAKVKVSSIKVGSDVIQAAHTARNIGVWFDSTMKFDEHVKVTCKSAWCHIRNISKIRKYLTEANIQSLIHAFISSKLDNNSSLLYGIEQPLLKKLQRVQNVAAQIVTKKSSKQNLIVLHWLPVKKRIEYKIALLVFKCLNNMGPSYLKDLLKPYSPETSCELRSLQEYPLDIPNIKLEYGRRSFSYCGPKIWNSLPAHLKTDITLNSFKSKLKTFLFKQAFDI